MQMIKGKVTQYEDFKYVMQDTGSIFLGARYSYREMESLLSDAGFLIYEFHDEKSAAEAFCKAHNLKNPGQEISSPKGVGYVLAVKKR